MSLDVKALEEELQRDPNSRRFSELAREYQRVGRLDEALALCEKGLQKHPSQAQGRLILAQIYLGQGRLEDSKGAVEKILMALPDHIAANHLAGDIFSSQGDLPRALRHYQVVDLFDPGRPDIANRIVEIQASSVRAALEGSLKRAEEESAMEEPPHAAQAENNQPDEDATTQEVPVLSRVEEGAELLGGTIRMAQIRPECSEDAPAGLAAEAASPPQERVSPPPSQDEVFSNLLPEAEDDLLGSDLLDVHEQTLLSLPKAPRAALQEVEKSKPACALPRASVPLPAAQRAVARVESAENKGEPSLAATPSFDTMTLAELYAHQGFPEKAVEIYQRVLLQDPDQPDIKRKIQDLKLRISGEAPELPEIHQEDVRRALRQRRVQVLEGWLKRVKEEQHV